MGTPARAPNRGAALTPPRAAAVAGVLFALLMGASVVVVRLVVPGPQEDPGDWLKDPSRRNSVRLAIHLIPFAGVAFLWFIGVIRNRLGSLEDQFFASVFLGSGLLYVGSIFASAAFSGALIETIANGHMYLLDNPTYYLARQLIAQFANVFAIRMAGVFIMSSSTIMLRTAILPRWVAILGFVCAAVLLLAITNWPWIALLFPVWMLVVSLCILAAEFRRGIDRRV